MIFDRESAQLMSAILCANNHGAKAVFITSQRKLSYVTDLVRELHSRYAIVPERSIAYGKAYKYTSGGSLEIYSAEKSIDAVRGREITAAWFDELGESVDEQKLAQIVLERVSRKRNTRNKNP